MISAARVSIQREEDLRGYKGSDLPTKPARLVHYWLVLCAGR
jgi:hypothetical protein